MGNLLSSDTLIYKLNDISGNIALNSSNNNNQSIKIISSNCIFMLDPLNGLTYINSSDETKADKYIDAVDNFYLSGLEKSGLILNSHIDKNNSELYTNINTSTVTGTLSSAASKTYKVSSYLKESGQGAFKINNDSARKLVVSGGIELNGDNACFYDGYPISDDTMIDFNTFEAENIEIKSTQYAICENSMFYNNKLYNATSTYIQFSNKAVVTCKDSSYYMYNKDGYDETSKDGIFGLDNILSNTKGITDIEFVEISAGELDDTIKEKGIIPNTNSGVSFIISGTTMYIFADEFLQDDAEFSEDLISQLLS